MQIKKDISIIVCFYNAGEKLIKTIEHLFHLNVSNLSAVELIFVDNNSNDDSTQIIKSTLKGFTKYPWKIVSESTPGLSHARLKGINASKHEVLLFCDDDNWLNSNYLQAGLKVLNHDENIAVLGGKGIPVSDIPFPDWFNSYLGYFAVGQQMPQTGLVKGTRNAVYGAGMFVRRSMFDVLIKKGFSSFSKDRVGNKLSSGGDSEMCLAFRIAGYKIWYDEKLEFQHYIEPMRISMDYVNKLKQGINESRFITRFYLDYIDGYRPRITPFFWFKEFCYSLKDLFISTIKRRKHAIERNWAFSKYLIRERTNYNNNVEQIVSLCNRLQQNDKN